MTSQLKILDCTLRDGGYYNNWDFDGEIVRDYLSALAEAKIIYLFS
jgi:4-hydroxy 2-oxovalerate aldolase